MSKEERKKLSEDIAEKFASLDKEDKQFIAGYIHGIQAERGRWEQMQAAGVSA